MVQKCPLFVNVYTIEICQRRGVGGQKKQNLVNVVCEPPLIPYQLLYLVYIFWCVGTDTLTAEVSRRNCYLDEGETFLIIKLQFPTLC